MQRVLARPQTCRASFGAGAHSGGVGRHVLCVGGVSCRDAQTDFVHVHAAGCTPVTERGREIRTILYDACVWDRLYEGMPILLVCLQLHGVVLQ